MKKDFIDFAKLKQIPIEKVAEWLGLPKVEGNQMRTRCPTCQTEDPRSLVVTVRDKKGKSSYYCFGEGRGGDATGLAAHINGVGQREAGLLMQKHFLKPEEKPTQKTKKHRTSKNGRKTEVPAAIHQNAHTITPPAEDQNMVEWLQTVWK